MAITSINITQDNFIGDSNLLAVHSPIIFIITANFTGSAPEILYCKVLDNLDDELGVFKCIPYLDVLATSRQFLFIADGILKGFMEPFDDFVQTSGSVEYCPGFTKEFTLRFYGDPSYIITELPIVAIHASRQFGESVNTEDIFNNEARTYIFLENKQGYVYFYNSDEANVIGTNPGTASDVFVQSAGNPFTNSEGDKFTGLGN